MHQVRHDGIQRALPFTRSTGAGAGVRPELTELLVVCFLRVGQSYLAAGGGVFTREEYGIGNLLHGQVPDGAQRAAASGAAGEFGPTVATDQVAALALQDGRQHIVKAHGTLEETGQVIVGGGGARQRGHPLRRRALGGSCGEGCGGLAAHFCNRETTHIQI